MPAPAQERLDRRIDAFVAERARGARSAVDVVFGAEIAQRPPSERPLLRAALEQASSAEAWRRAELRGADPATTMRRALRDLLTRT